MTGPAARSEPRVSLVQRYALPPAEIERRSLGLVSVAIGSKFGDAQERFVAGRVVYAAGDLDLADAIRMSERAVTVGIDALRSAASVVTDVRMVQAGLDRRRLERLGCPLLCAIDDPGVAEAARASGLPRAVEAMRALLPSLGGAVVCIGNAPTALLSLLDMVDAHLVAPALIIGMPVGFVAAAEAKQELTQRTTPYITIVGNRGGSPLAAAAVNALLRLAEPAP